MIYIDKAMGLDDLAAQYPHDIQCVSDPSKVTQGGMLFFLTSSAAFESVSHDIVMKVRTHAGMWSSDWLGEYREKIRQRIIDEIPWAGANYNVPLDWKKSIPSVDGPESDPESEPEADDAETANDDRLNADQPSTDEMVARQKQAAAEESDVKEEEANSAQAAQGGGASKEHVNWQHFQVPDLAAHEGPTLQKPPTP